jgi:hypothetical protein
MVRDSLTQRLIVSACLHHDVPSSLTKLLVLIRYQHGIASDP